MSFYCPYLATATSASPTSFRAWLGHYSGVCDKPRFFQKPHIWEIMWYLASCLHLLCRTMHDRWRILPCAVSPVPLVHKGIKERSVSMPRKTQCNGGIKLRLTTSRHYDMPYARKFAMTLSAPLFPCNAPAEAGWAGTGCVWGKQGVGVSLAWCSWW